MQFLPLEVLNYKKAFRLIADDNNDLYIFRSF